MFDGLTLFEAAILGTMLAATDARARQGRDHQQGRTGKGT